MKLQSLQVLRFFAATLVVICHATDNAFALGAIGVDVFFVVSGFIITRVATTKTPAEFIRDRLFRIYPIYWICAIPSALLAIHFGATSASRTLTSITLWPVFGGAFLQPYLVLGWTLSFEMLFYACTALVLLERRALWLIALGYPLSMFGAFLTGAPILRFVGNPLILEFLMGVAIARMGRTDSHPMVGAAAIIAAALVVIVAFDADRLYLPLHAFELTAPERPLAWGIPAAMLVWGALQLDSYTRAWRVLPRLGDASYSIYLSHGLALILFAFLPWQLQVVAAVAFGALVYRSVEAPLLRRLHQVGRPARTPGEIIPTTSAS